MTSLPEKEGFRHQRVGGLFERGVKRYQSISNRLSLPPPPPPSQAFPRHLAGVFLRIQCSLWKQPLFLASCCSMETFHVEELLWLSDKKFHNNNVKSVWNRVRSADWSMERLDCFSYCLRFTDNEKFTDNEECQEMLMSSRKTQMLLLKKNIFYKYCLLC